MRKLIFMCFALFMTFFAFSDTYLEDHIEDVLEAKYSYISDNSKYLELDFDVHEKGNNLTVTVKVDDDSYKDKAGFSKRVFNNYVNQIEKTAKSEAKGKNVIVKSYF